MKVFDFLHKKKSVRNVFPGKRVVLLVPTFKPTETTIEFVKSVRVNHPEVLVVIVEDCIPFGTVGYKVFQKIKRLTKNDSGMVCLRTPHNSHKAGALNYGIAFVSKMDPKPHVIFTSDDDVIVNERTIPEMVNELYRGKRIGAVCSQSLVKNRKSSLLTRLQALEYRSFTATKLADKYFLKGPLVMQGMLTAFRVKALKDVDGFTEHHLIEDYDITARLKRKNWRSSIAQNAMAWTEVPETLKQLWRQRVRWGYGGIEVVTANLRYTSAVFQDLVGHGLFLTLLVLIILSFVFQYSWSVSDYMILALIALAIVHFVLTMAFNILMLLDYEEKDALDWLIKLTIVPEFIYSNLLTLVVVGCYIYWVYNQTAGYFSRRFKWFTGIYNAGLRLFDYLGYSSGWGTRIVKVYKK